MSSLNPVDFGASLNAIGNAGSAHAQSALKVKAKAKDAAQNFESMFLNNMFQQMMTHIDGDGPFGGSGALCTSGSVDSCRRSRTRNTSTAAAMISSAAP